MSEQELVDSKAEPQNLGQIRIEKEQVRVNIRWMIRRDLPEILQTEQASFDFAWTEEDFLRCLRQRNCIGMTAEQGEKVVGFMIYELHKDSIYIRNFAVHPNYRRLGVATQMVVKLISKLSSHRRTRITFEMRETNLAAQLFFRVQRFRALRVVRNYFEDTGEDAFFMQYQIPCLETDEDEIELYGPRGDQFKAPDQSKAVHIRHMVRGDMTKVLQTEEASFDFAWTEEDLLRLMRQKNCTCLVATQDDVVIGYIIWQKISKGPLHIAKLAVHPKCRGRGAGTKLVAKAISRLRKYRVKQITLELRETNLAAQLFFRKLRFRAIGVDRDLYKEDTGEAAFLMQYLPEPAAVNSLP